MTPTHDRDDRGRLWVECHCYDRGKAGEVLTPEEAVCYYHRLSYELDTEEVFTQFEGPGYAIVEHEADLPATLQAVYAEAIELACGDDTWQGGATLRLGHIRVGKRYPMPGEPGEVFLL